MTLPVEKDDAMRFFQPRASDDGAEELEVASQAMNEDERGTRIGTEALDVVLLAVSKSNESRIAG